MQEYIPQIFIIDIACYEPNTGIRLRENFAIPKTLDLEEFFLPDQDPNAIPPSFKYELFGAIVAEGENFSESNYFPLIKKRHKVSKKFQWYAFN